MLSLCLTGVGPSLPLESFEWENRLSNWRCSSAMSSRAAEMPNRPSPMTANVCFFISLLLNLLLLQITLLIDLGTTDIRIPRYLIVLGVTVGRSKGRNLRAEAASDDEEDMLDLAAGVARTSRLSPRPAEPSTTKA